MKKKNPKKIKEQRKRREDVSSHEKQMIFDCKYDTVRVMTHE